MASRRGFLKSLVTGIAAGPAVLASQVAGMEIPAEVGSEKTFFNFTCGCGESLMAETPKKEGVVVSIPCQCGMVWNMEWMGDHFQTKGNGSGWQRVVSELMQPVALDEVDHETTVTSVNKFLQLGDKNRIRKERHES